MIETDERAFLSQFYAKEERLSIGTFLSQGALVGGFMGFASIVTGMLSRPENSFNFFLMFYLLPFVLSGMVFGAFEGSFLWACTHFARRRFNFLLRACIGLVVHYALMTSTLLLWPGRSSDEPLPTAVYLVFYFGFGLVFGLVVGSRFQPWHELFRGTTSTPWRSVATGLTGLALRVVVILSLMESVLNLIWERQRLEMHTDYMIAVIAVGHFVAAVVIVFVRMPTWLLLQLALLVNFPVILFITEVLRSSYSPMWTLSFIYLAIWFAFLVTRLTALPELREETFPSDRSGARS